MLKNHLKCPSRNIMCVTGSLVQGLSGTFGVSKAVNGVELVSPA